MKAKAKNNSSALVGILVFIAVMLIFISIPFVSYAQTGTLGTASPEVYCTYEKDGEQFDGDNLPAGTYDVSFVLSGLTDTSVLQVTATYDTEQVTVADAPSALLSDGENSQFDSIGYKLSDGNIVFGFISTNDDCSSVDEDGQVIATVSMTFASDCDPDADNLIVVSENPNHTFAQADYGDGFKDEYAIVDDGVTSVEGYDGSLYSMKCDVTPSGGQSVTANLVVMTDSKGSTKGTAPYGTFTIDLYDQTKTKLIGTYTSQFKTENNKNVNEFKIDNLAKGTYCATISSEYAIPRDVIINVGDADIPAKDIPIVVYDFNGSGDITGADAITVYKNAAGAQNLYCDLNGSGDVTGADAIIIYACAAAAIDYGEFIIE